MSADPSLPCSPFPLSLSLSSSPTTPDPFDADPSGPMRYLRQQSAPSPKFTSTLEARIEDSFSHARPQIRSRSTEPPSGRALSPKPVPLLTPKPYFQSQSAAAEPWPTKVSHEAKVITSSCDKHNESMFDCFSVTEVSLASVGCRPQTGGEKLLQLPFHEYHRAAMVMSRLVAHNFLPETRFICWFFWGNYCKWEYLK